MSALSQRSFNATVRHQVLLERLKRGEVKELLPFLRELDRKLRLRLSGDELTAFGRLRLDRLLVEVEGLIDRVLGRYTGELQQDLFRLAASEAAFEARSLTEAVRNPRFEAAVPAESQVLAAVMASPLSVRGPGGGSLLESFLKDYTEAQKKRLVGAIRQGVFEGQTNAQIVRAIRGTAALRHTDGLLAVSQRQAEGLVRTSVQHVSSVARNETYAANDDLVHEYQWVSTLDNRTSEICQSLDGTRYKVGEGPMPPAHVNCRSSTVPVLDERFSFLKEGATRASKDGPVDANQTYFSWLKDQPEKFQDAAIGPTRAKLLRDGGLSADRFAQLGLSRDFKPLTLAEMQRLEPLAFERAGITINPDSGRVVGQ